MTKNNIYSKIPNLLSPIEYRHWSPLFYIGGKEINKKLFLNYKNIWFTKGDGDRDFPTQHDLKND